MDSSIKYIIGVDGGGTGTRVVITDSNFNLISSANGPSSALGQGIEKAWQSILETISVAFSRTNLKPPMLSECAIGIGISGANNIVWKNQFYLLNPGFKKIVIDTDGFTTLLGAHGGKDGVIVAIGTGSVGMIFKNGERKSVSGWGFPSGDEASGAWLGLRAAELTQKTLDHRRPHSELSKKVLNHCGESPETFLEWLGNASQNTYAELAPLIFDSAKDDIDAKNLLQMAGNEIQLMINALDPNIEHSLCICGRLGEALIPYLPLGTQNRNKKPIGDSTAGAIELIKIYL